MYYYVRIIGFRKLVTLDNVQLYYLVDIMTTQCLPTFSVFFIYLFICKICIYMHFIHVVSERRETKK